MPRSVTLIVELVIGALDGLRRDGLGVRTADVYEKGGKRGLWVRTGPHGIHEG
jgi:hypothetical protein